MVDVAITTREGASASITSGHVDKFSDRLRGDLILKDHQVYDQARRVWNGNIDRRPALIARCVGVADVMDSIEFAREHDLLSPSGAERTTRQDTAPAMVDWSSTSLR